MSKISLKAWRERVIDRRDIAPTIRSRMSASRLFSLTEPLRNRPWLGYLTAALLPLLAWGVVHPLSEIARHFPFIIFLPTVVVATLLAGAGPGVLAALITLLIVDFFLIEPIGELWPVSSVGWWSFGFYTLAISLVIGVIEGMTRAYRKLDATDAELRHAHAALSIERQRLRAVIDQAPVGVSIARRDGGSELNGRARALIGHGLVTDDDQRYASYGAIHPDGRNYAVEDYPTMRALRTGEVVESEDMLYRVGGRGDGGDLRRLAVSSSPVLDGADIVGAVTVLVDVTEQRAAREALEQLTLDLERQVAERTAELALYRDIVQSHATPICAFDPELRLTVFNVAHADEFERISGHRVQPGEHFPALFPDDQASMVRGFMERALAGEVFTITGEFGHDDFEKPLWESRYAPLRDNTGSIVGAFHHAVDITARRRAEIELGITQEALRQSQKMEAVGQLTGGIAHDFNNLLTIIRGSVDMLRRPDVSADRRARHLEAVSDTVDRAAKLTGQLLAFARRQALKPETFDVGDRVRTVADMIDTIVGARITIQVEAEADRFWTHADAPQFETALINMAVNARDAMDGAGRLTLQLSGDQPLPAIRGHAGAKGPFISVTLADTGSGIGPDQIDKIFEPFFTTKSIGKGTGLGLSQVFGFAKQSGGDIAVQSEAGRGSAFTLYLPQAERPHRVADVQQAWTAAAGGCRVLVVEDNLDIGRFVTELLADLGYEHVWVTNAEEALEQLEKPGHGFDVVFSDVVMPGMGGIALAREIKARDLGLRVILTSGYSHVLAEEGVPEFKLLRKPYSAEQLVAHLSAGRSIALRAG